jgi:hypothetical protein
MTRLIRDLCPDSSHEADGGTRTPDRLDRNQGSRDSQTSVAVVPWGACRRKSADYAAE